MSLRKRRFDILIAIFWAGLASLRLAAFLAQPTPPQAGQFLFTLIIMVLFIQRKPSSAQGSRSSFWLAMGATVLPGLALKPAETGLPVFGMVVQSGGLALMLLAVLVLNRSFGIAPANRGLVTHGPYRLVRHPLYAGELIQAAGYCLGYASVWNWVVWLATFAAQLMRIRAEEKLLSDDSTYQTYQARVPWRLVPGLW